MTLLYFILLTVFSVGIIVGVFLAGIWLAEVSIKKQSKRKSHLDIVKIEKRKPL